MVFSLPEFLRQILMHPKVKLFTVKDSCSESFCAKDQFHMRKENDKGYLIEDVKVRF